MRKFAKSIGSEGKSCWNRGDKCRQDPGAPFGLYGVSALCTLRASGSSCPEATVSGGGHPPLLPQHGLGGLRPVKPKIANSELLTAENPTV